MSTRVVYVCSLLQYSNRILNEYEQEAYARQLYYGRIELQHLKFRYDKLVNKCQPDC